MIALLSHYAPVLLAFTVLMLVIVPANHRITKAARRELRERRAQWEQNRADEMRQRYLVKECGE